MHRPANPPNPWTRAEGETAEAYIRAEAFGDEPADAFTDRHHSALPPVRVRTLTVGEARAAKLADLRDRPSALDSDFGVYLAEHVVDHLVAARLVLLHRPARPLHSTAARPERPQGKWQPEDYP